jgi:outer membrane biosynthesis protein TonB
MAGSALTREEGLGLAISIAGHAALLAVLLLRPAADNVVIPPERVEVTISQEVGLTSTSPQPKAQAAPDEAPDLGEAAPAPEPEPAPLPPPPAPRVIEPPKPPTPRPVVKPQPKKPEPRRIEARKPDPAKPPKPVVREAAKPKPSPAKPSPPKPSAIDRLAKPSTRQAPAAPTKAATPPKQAGGTRFAEAFKSGTPGATSPAGTGAPAAAIGPQQISALNAAIGRQLKPHWRGKAPEGAEAELLVTKVRFRLNRDGSLAGEPQVVATSGQTEANQPQVARHQEQAVRAVKLAAPFDLPEALYDGWKTVTTNFDRRLSQ